MSSLPILMLRLAVMLFWLSLIQQPTAAWAADPQYRESDLDFVSRLFARLDAVEASIAGLESRLGESSSKPVSSNVTAAQARALENPKPARGGAASEPQADGDADHRVPESLRHKQRAVNANPDELGRIKLKFPWLRDEIAKARQDLLSHKPTPVPQSDGQNNRQPDLVNAERAVIEIEKNLATLTAEVQAAERARTTKTIVR